MEHQPVYDDTFPRGEPCRLAIGHLPDDENEYYWTAHYEKRRRERDNPPVTDAVVETVLTEGFVHDAGRSSDDEHK